MTKRLIMATSVKTAISMQEELFKEVNKLAEELHVSRSKLFVMAVQDYIKKTRAKNCFLKLMTPSVTILILKKPKYRARCDKSTPK